MGLFIFAAFSSASKGAAASPGLAKRVAGLMLYPEHSSSSSWEGAAGQGSKEGSAVSWKFSWTLIKKSVSLWNSGVQSLSISKLNLCLNGKEIKGAFRAPSVVSIHGSLDSQNPWACFPSEIQVVHTALPLMFACYSQGLVSIHLPWKPVNDGSGVFR